MGDFAYVAGEVEKLKETLTEINQRLTAFNVTTVTNGIKEVLDRFQASLPSAVPGSASGSTPTLGTAALESISEVAGALHLSVGQALMALVIGYLIMFGLTLVGYLVRGWWTQSVMCLGT